MHPGVSEILSVLKSTNEHQKVLSLLIDRMVRLYHCQTAAVIIIDPKTEYLSVENSEGLSAHVLQGFRTKIATALSGDCYGPVYRCSSRVWRMIQRLSKKCGLSIPLLLPFVCRSLLTVERLDICMRTAESLMHSQLQTEEFFQAFADFAGLAMVKAHLHEENMRLNPYDNETGLLKYHAFFEKFEDMLQRAESSEECFSILLMDVDNYKEVVRIYGHDPAKAMLREIADTVRGSLRSIDSCGRYGFDEFIVLLENRNLHEAVADAKRIAKKIHETLMTPQKIQTSVSMGVCTYPQHGEAQQELLLAAKEALFEAQRSGRNKVVSVVLPQKGTVV